jgi:pyruvate,phosphate dikinase
LDKPQTTEGKLAVQIFRFSADLCDWKNTHEGTSKKHLGGKGAALVKMAQAGMNVPPGFTLPTEVCNELSGMAAKEQNLAYTDAINEIMARAKEGMEWLTEKFGFTPLVSVRSGAPVSMPGMMDTILNVGLTNQNLDEWADRIGFRAALDSQRRLIQMLGSTAYGVPHEVFEFQLARIKKEAGVELDAELDTDYLEALIEAYLQAFKQNQGFDFPVNDPDEQLSAAIMAVFESWQNDRAIEYRKINKIDPSMGTAVNVQAMVFGNMGDDSGTGVLFTRNPSTGEAGIMGEFLQNAQGEDVVAGIRTPVDIWDMNSVELQDTCWPGIYKQIEAVCSLLEGMYDDMVDVEFTVQQGELFILQSRSGKRSARAAFKIATDLFQEGVIDIDTALSRLKKEQFKVVRRPMLDPAFKDDPDEIGLPACPGVVSGKPVFSSEDAVNCKEPCILITHETTPEDIKGMAAAIGILTQTGGATSHAAVVARAMDKTCVVGCTGLDLDAAKGCTKVTIDGSTGRVWFNRDVPVIDSSDAPEVGIVMDWCMGRLDAYESYPVGQDFGLHAVQATHWWGNKDVAEAVVADLNPDLCILDLRGPREFMRDSDQGLMSCFGQSEPKFGPVLREVMVDHKDKLKGLKVVADPADAQFYEAAGFNVIEAPQIVPSDFAAFSVLAD